MFVLLVTVSCAAAPPVASTTPSSSSTSSGDSTASITSALTTSTSVEAPLAGKTIVLDPGHNGMNWAHPDEINQLVDIGTGTKPCNTSGTNTDDGYAESSFSWQVAQLTAPLLEALGAVVVLTRHDNEGWGPCITERAAIGNEVFADAAISIHADGGPSDGRGFHVIHPAVVEGLTDDVAGDSLRLAEAVHEAYLTTGMPVADYVGAGGFSERSDLGGLTLSDVPVVFLEAGNMRNAVDASLLVDSSFQSAIARALVDALVEFLS